MKKGHNRATAGEKNPFKGNIYHEYNGKYPAKRLK